MAEISLDKRYRLKDSVRVRNEVFGALLFDMESESVFVVRPPAAIPLLGRLDGTATLRQIVAEEYGDASSEAPSLTIIENLASWGAIDEG